MNPEEGKEFPKLLPKELEDTKSDKKEVGKKPHPSCKTWTMLLNDHGGVRRRSLGNTTADEYSNANGTSKEIGLEAQDEEEFSPSAFVEDEKLYPPASVDDELSPLSPLVGLEKMISENSSNSSKAGCTRPKLPSPSPTFTYKLPTGETIIFSMKGNSSGNISDMMLKNTSFSGTNDTSTSFRQHSSLDSTITVIRNDRTQIHLETSGSIFISFATGTSLGILHDKTHIVKTNLFGTAQYNPDGSATFQRPNGDEVFEDAFGNRTIRFLSGEGRVEKCEITASGKVSQMLRNGIWHEVDYHDGLLSHPGEKVAKHLIDHFKNISDQLLHSWIAGGITDPGEAIGRIEHIINPLKERATHDALSQMTSAFSVDFEVKDYEVIKSSVDEEEHIKVKEHLSLGNKSELATAVSTLADGIKEIQNKTKLRARELEQEKKKRWFALKNRCEWCKYSRCRSCRLKMWQKRLKDTALVHPHGSDHYRHSLSLLQNCVSFRFKNREKITQ
eukprot:g5380.t1